MKDMTTRRREGQKKSTKVSEITSKKKRERIKDKEREGARKMKCKGVKGPQEIVTRD